MRCYVGTRSRKGHASVLLWVGPDGQTLPPRLDLANKSPNGYEWGYLGSGPAQLALAILADACHDDQVALLWFESFKWDVIARLPPEGFTLTEEDVANWMVWRLARELMGLDNVDLREDDPC